MCVGWLWGVCRAGGGGGESGLNTPPHHQSMLKRFTRAWEKVASENAVPGIGLGGGGSTGAGYGAPAPFEDTHPQLLSAPETKKAVRATFDRLKKTRSRCVCSVWSDEVKLECGNTQR